jgi:7,8-dihydropterin-6-yl-methyl-4-(beta-D-ribofuranosyl)aminobenzene 5'-phosphate synthase
MNNPTYMNSKTSTVNVPIQLIIVFDNHPFAPNLGTSMGFACIIKGFEKTILFDTGSDGRLLLANIKALGYRPEDIDIVFLSHDHWDHTDGLGAILERNPEITVVLPVDFPSDFKDKIRRAGAVIEEISQAKQISPGVWSTGVLGNGIREQSLICLSPKGAVVMTGCAHPGIVKIIEVAKNISPDIYLVMGGFHLGGAPLDELRATGEQFRRLNVRRVAPCHCSSHAARELFEEIYRFDAMLIGVGSKITIPNS